MKRLETPLLCLCVIHGVEIILSPFFCIEIVTDISYESQRSLFSSLLFSGTEPLFLRNLSMKPHTDCDRFMDIMSPDWVQGRENRPPMTAQNHNNLKDFWNLSVRIVCVHPATHCVSLLRLGHVSSGEESGAAEEDVVLQEALEGEGGAHVR